MMHSHYRSSFTSECQSLTAFQDEPLKAAVRRLRSAVKICLDKAKYEKSLTALRDSNADLTVLRSQITEFQSRSSSGATCLTHSTLPSRIGAIRTASQNLHEALCASWCCEDIRHDSHNAKLCLDVEVEAEVRLDLAISCQDTPQQRPAQR
jgi:hypothetical protein